MSKRAQELAEAHWRGYIRPMLETHEVGEPVYTFSDLLRIVEFHYIKTAVHFHGHGAEDQRNGLLSAPTPPLPDPWDRCACGKLVAECGVGGEAVRV